MWSVDISVEKLDGWVGGKLCFSGIEAVFCFKMNKSKKVFAKNSFETKLLW